MLNINQLEIVARPRAGFSHSCDMAHVTARLKELRKAAVPRLTVRGIAEALDMPFGSYARFESESSYKKRQLPLDFARKVAAILAQHGIDPAEVMKLAGLNDAEAEPEAREIEATRPSVQFAVLSVALPSEAALTDMFRTMLVAVPEGASRDEAARTLAQLLPSGFAAIGSAALVPGMGAPIAVATAPQSPATDDRGSGPPSHS